MRILLLSDLHGDHGPLLRLLAERRDFELVLIAGDLTEFGGEREAREILAPLRASGLPLAAVSGNCDREGVRLWLEEAGLSAEGRCLTLDGLRIAGAGGGLHRHGLTPFEPTEDELEANLEGALGSCTGEGRPLLVLTHTPPNGTALDRRGNSHVGSHAFRSILASRVPLLWVSGHIHEARSLSVLGATTLVNPGSLREGFFATADLEVEGEGGLPRIKVRLEELSGRRRP